MSNNAFRRVLRNSMALLILLLVSLPAAAQFTSAKRRPDPGPMPKNIHGIVQDSQGKPLMNARVYIRDMKSSVTRTQTTDKDGLYSIFALTPTVDYEVYAEFNGKLSDKRVVSSFLNRQDNVLNFQLDVTSAAAPALANDTSAGPEFNSFDLVRLHASYDVPSGVPAPIPAVLLLHGYGEDRNVWGNLKKQLLMRGWAVLALDLRGHGESKTRNGLPIQASPDWRNSSNEFPQDLDPALDWIKSQTRLDNNKIVVIGSDVGGELALISGRFPEVRTVVAMNPKLSESLAMAGSAQDFTPRSALILTTDEAEGNKIKALVKEPVKVQIFSISGGTEAWINNRQVTDAIFEWLKQTF